MKTLPQVTATAEQLPIISQNQLGIEVICGAAGSGKTTTALLRLKSLFYMFATRRARENDTEPVRALVLTFNRTLAGYVRNLAEHQISEDVHVDLEIETFARWAMTRLDYPEIQENAANNRLRALAGKLGHLTADYLINEVEYLLGRFPPDELERYITVERTGRGIMPRVGQQLRRKILTEIVIPYQEWLAQNGILDWNMLALQMASSIDAIGYDIVVVDESQDFPANQLRAIQKHLGNDHAVTFVIDTVQRIYARGFTWTEAGYEIRSGRTHTLRQNHRNSRQIARFAAGILDGIDVEGDGALPNLEHAYSDGPMPIVLKGRYNNQRQWAIDYISDNVDLTNDSVAFLKAKGGGWFSEIRKGLREHGVGFANITREAEWPEGSANVALCTFHSAKGLEFDYVFIIGLNEETTPYGDEESEDKVFVLRRLLAVAVARARKAVIVGYKPGEESKLVAYFKPGTFVEHDI